MQTDQNFASKRARIIVLAFKKFLNINFLLIKFTSKGVSKLIFNFKPGTRLSSLCEGNARFSHSFLDKPIIS